MSAEVWPDCDSYGSRQSCIIAAYQCHGFDVAVAASPEDCDATLCRVVPITCDVYIIIGIQSDTSHGTSIEACVGTAYRGDWRDIAGAAG